MHGACWNHFSVWRIALVADFWQKKRNWGPNSGPEIVAVFGPLLLWFKAWGPFLGTKNGPRKGTPEFYKIAHRLRDAGLYLETCLGAAAACRMLPWVGLGEWGWCSRHVLWLVCVGVFDTC